MDPDGKIDPTFFSTCRLCVSTPGSYQILPQVKLQIKELFDINVDAYDGLPQLLCNECRSIVTKLHIIRCDFQRKQQELVLRTKGHRIEENVQIPLEEKSENRAILQDSLPDIEKPSARTASTPSGHKSNNVRFQSKRSRFDTALIEVKCEAETAVSVLELRLPFTRWSKRYVCKLCSGIFLQLTHVIEHLKTHSALLELQLRFRVRHCCVAMPRFIFPTQKHTDQSIGKERGLKMVNVFDNYIVYSRRRLTELFTYDCSAVNIDRRGQKRQPHRRYHYESKSGDSKDSVTAAPAPFPHSETAPKPVTPNSTALAPSLHPFSKLVAGLRMMRILLTDDLKNHIGLNDAKALAVYDLSLTEDSEKLLVKLYVCLSHSNVFCFEVVDRHGRLVIDNEPCSNQMKILHSLVQPCVIQVSSDVAKRISVNVSENTVRFLQATKYILEQP